MWKQRLSALALLAAGCSNPAELPRGPHPFVEPTAAQLDVAADGAVSSTFTLRWNSRGEAPAGFALSRYAVRFFDEANAPVPALDVAETALPAPLTYGGGPVTLAWKNPALAAYAKDRVLSVRVSFYGGEAAFMTGFVTRYSAVQKSVAASPSPATE